MRGGDGLHISLFGAIEASRLKLSTYVLNLNDLFYIFVVNLTDSARQIRRTAVSNVSLHKTPGAVLASSAQSPRGAARAAAPPHLISLYFEHLELRLEANEGVRLGTGRSVHPGRDGTVGSKFHDASSGSKGQVASVSLKVARGCEAGHAAVAEVRRALHGAARDKVGVVVMSDEASAHSASTRYHSIVHS